MDLTRRRYNEEFAIGSILRLKLKDFLTYDDVEVFPGPNLNVIIGPNGTGKSSIVCAICLGLGGNPSVIGRSTDVKDFVKHGKKVATIEIELRIENEKSKLIVYKIRKEGSNEFFVDSRKATKHQVVELARRYRIQVDNLCQFLAQDRVVEFSKITTQDLLTSTEKAISSDLLAQHDTLKERQVRGGDYRVDLEGWVKDKERLDSELAELEPQYRAYYEYQARQEKIKHLEQKKAWLEYEEERKTFEEGKKKLEQKKEELEGKRSEQDPIKKALDKLKAQVNDQNRRMGRRKEEVTALERTVEKHAVEVERAEEELRRIHHSFASSMEEQRQHQLNIDHLKDSIRSLDRDIKNLEDQPDVSPALREKETKHSETRNKIQTMQEQINTIHQERNMLIRKLEEIRGELRQRKDIQRLRLNRLRQMSDNAYQLWLWYLEHQQEFQKPIRIPLLSINLSNPANAKYFENVVAERDLQMFICGTNQDNDRLIRQMRAMNLYANATVVSSDFQIERYQLSAQMKQVGFRCFLVDMMDAPEEVTQFLCNINHINRIPVGTRETEKQMERVQQALLQEKINLALTENKRISIKHSRYTGDCSVSDTCLREGNWLKTNTIASDQQNFEREEKNLSRKLADNERRGENLEEKIAEQKFVAEQLRSQMRELRDQKQRCSVLKNQRKTSVDQLKTLQSLTFDSGSQKAEVHRKLEVVIDRKIVAMEKMSNVLEQLEEKVDGRVYACLQKAELVGKVEEKQKTFIEAANSLKLLEEEVCEVELLQTEKRIRLRQAMKKISELCGLPADLQAVSEEDKARQAELFKMMKSLPKRIEDVEKAINEEKGRQDVGGRIEDRIVKEYEEKKERSVVLEKNLERLKAKVDNWDKETGELKTAWLEELEILVQKISKNFSDFFRLLGCAGEVVIDRSVDEDDFASYGIGINVKFRDNEPMRRLTHQHQSGGERSVATMLYMLALQELSEVPFRCVDEINQGMDPINERKVFEMVVNLLSGSGDQSTDGNTNRNLGRTQYFMLTPKLLPNLSFSRKMTVLIVHNGPGMLDGRKWDTQKFIERKRAEHHISSTPHTSDWSP